MKSSQSKTTQPSSASDTHTASSSRARDESALSRRDQQHNEPGQVEDIRGRNEFSNLQEQQGQYNPTAAESYASYEGVNQPQYSQENTNFRQQGSQPYQQSQFNRQNDMQNGISALVDAWTGLVLGQVQIATQATIRLAQCCFSPSLISGISEVQRRYAEDSISSASAAASRLAQFTPSALNQNQQCGQSSYNQGYSQSGQRQQQYG